MTEWQPLHRRFNRRTSAAQMQRLDRRQLLFGGDLDPAFSGDGMVNVPGEPGTSRFAEAVDSQSDGKAVVGFETNTVDSRWPSMGVARLNVDGSLDTTYGSNGIASAAFPDDLYGPLVNAVVTGVAVQPDNKTVVAGWAVDPYNGRVFGTVARFDVNGILDPSFSGNGTFILPDFNDLTVGSIDNYITDVTVQTDGRIVLVGYSYTDQTHTQIGVARLNANGTLDTTFAGDGARLVDAGSDEEVGHAVAVGSDGKIVVVGSSTPITNTATGKFVIARLQANGSYDNTFDGDGRLSTTLSAVHTGNSANDVVVRSDGKIIFAGSVRTPDIATLNAAVVRLNVDGSRDTTFGTSNGQIEVDFGGLGARNTADSIIFGKSGRLIVGGSMSGQMAIFGLDADGHYDSRFAGDGTLTTSFPKGSGVRDLALGYGGKVFAVGGDYLATARIIDRADVTTAIGTFNPTLKEEGATSSAFLVTREESRPYATRVFLNYVGSALIRNVRDPRDVDAFITGLTYAGTTNLYYVDIPANSTFVSVTVRALDDVDIEGDETIAFKIVPNDAYDGVPPAETTFYIRDNDGVPAVTSSSFNYLTKPHSITMTFSQNVESSLTIDDFVFSGTIPLPARTLSYNASGNIATITFAGGVLVDGLYYVTLPAGAVTNYVGTASTTAANLPFYFLTGDANGDRAVNFDDLLIVGKNYGQTGRNWLTGDFNYDGMCNFDDLLLLAKRYGLSFATSATALSVATPVDAVPQRTRRTAFAETIVE